jgi:hypothetical protein
MTIATAKRVCVLSVILMLVSTLGLYFETAFIVENYFLLMWWPWILLMTAYFIQAEKKLPWRDKAEFWRICLASVFIWTFFEAYNLKFANWAYINIGPQPPIRWLCYSISFATVIPGLWLAMQMIYPKMKIKAQRRKLIKNWEVTYILIGVFCALSPLIYPATCFALVWVAFIFLLEPFLYHSKFPSLTREYENGDDRRLTALLFAGVVTGLLWESWNYYAGAKWIYTLPFFEDKLFEMPFAGFLGFPPFAVECWVMYHFMRAVFSKLELRQRRCLAIALTVAVHLIYFNMDIFTVRS